MIADRLEFSLRNLQHSDWERFEKLASTFLADEFSSLHTVASPNGDDGRDAELFSPSGEPSVLIQFSVTPKWDSKIKDTHEKIKLNFPAAIHLIYVTNQLIGANADKLKRSLRNQGISLTVYDRNWFIERANKSEATKEASERLSTIVVDPILNQSKIGSKLPPEITRTEAIAAVTYLGLQWKDESRDKGLTKIVFEGLVKSALENTDENNLISEDEVISRVLKVTSFSNEDKIRDLTKKAFDRLIKKSIRSYKKPEGQLYCLSFEERERVKDYKIRLGLAEDNVSAAISKIASARFYDLTVPPSTAIKFHEILRQLIDTIIFEKSQLFAMAIHTSTLNDFDANDFDALIINTLTQYKLPRINGIDWKNQLRGAVREIFTSEEIPLVQHFRSLSDAYTLLAFLKQTPDVQGIVKKMFSHGSIWLDTTIVLPLLSEFLIEESETPREIKRFTLMINSAKNAGLKMYVTPGVIEEVERHINRSIRCSEISLSSWNGSIPFLFAKYMETGRSGSWFKRWTENFCGDSRPTDDISEYLDDQYGIKTRSLETECRAAPDDLKNSLNVILHENYKNRQVRFGYILDENSINRLVQHDIECYAGVTQLRSQEKSSPFGYDAWWLTVDRKTFGMHKTLASYMHSKPPSSPVMSADFLIDYLAFGPERQKIPKATEAQFPIMMLRSATFLTPELMKEATDIREGLKDKPERVIRRQIRDHLDQAKAKIGKFASVGMMEIDEDLSDDF